MDEFRSHFQNLWQKVMNYLSELSFPKALWSSTKEKGSDKQVRGCPHGALLRRRETEEIHHI